MVRFQKVIFILFSSLVFAVLAMMLSRFFIPKNVGLAGGAMVLFYGLFGLIIGMIGSIAIRNKLPLKFLQISNAIFGLFLIFCGFRIDQQMAASKAKVERERERYKHLKPTAQAVPIGDQEEMSIGIAQVHLKEDRPIYFYAKPEMGQLADQLTPIDSITFKGSPNGIEIATAPPWLVPERLKLDYQIFHFLVIAQNRSFMQVVVNSTNGQTAWMDKSQLSYQDWSSFLLAVYAIQPLDWDNNPLRSKPLTHASPLLEIDSGYILQPLTIEGNWIEVKILDQHHQTTGRAWLRWRSDTELLISYELLS
ncbi:MAG: hypothetical protein KTR30_19010 [Saprospiraceae bacterium]|nr:hypothetical protein [Saprospiraceae bacterium]